jgi:hypothetical protein
MSTLAAKAKSAVLTETKNNREYIAIDFETMDEPKRVYRWMGFFGDDYGKDNLSTTQRTFTQLRACGWKGNDVTDLSSVIGVPCDITIKSEEYNGVPQIKVSFINLLGEGGFKTKPIDATKGKSLARSLAAQAAQIKPTTRPSNGHPNAPGNDFGPPSREPGSDDF